MSDTSRLVIKTKFNPKLTEIEGKIPDTTDLVTKIILIQRLYRLKIKHEILMV